MDLLICLLLGGSLFDSQEQKCGDMHEHEPIHDKICLQSFSTSLKDPESWVPFKHDDKQVFKQTNIGSFCLEYIQCSRHSNNIKFILQFNSFTRKSSIKTVPKSNRSLFCLF